MSTPYPFSAVLFDLDGVVIDTTALHYRVWTEFAHAHHYHPTPAELLATNGRRAGETIRAWLGPDLDEQEIAALTADREAHFNHLLATAPVPPVPGVQAFVAALAAAGVPRAVATSAVPANAQLALARVDLADAFDAVVTAADVHHGKPHPEPYLKAAASLRADPSRCLVIEDSVPGLRSAQAAGARRLALSTTFPPETLAAEHPDYLLPDFLNLPPELQPQVPP